MFILTEFLEWISLVSDKTANLWHNNMQNITMTDKRNRTLLLSLSKDRTTQEWRIPREWTAELYVRYEIYIQRPLDLMSCVTFITTLRGNDSSYTL